MIQIAEVKKKVEHANEVLIATPIIVLGSVRVMNGKQPLELATATQFGSVKLSTMRETLTSWNFNCAKDAFVG